MVENVGVAFGIMSVCRWKLKLHMTTRTENIRFFHGGCPWFNGFLQELEKAVLTRRTPEYPELNRQGTGL